MTGARKRFLIPVAVIALAAMVVGAGAVGAALGDEKPLDPSPRTETSFNGTPRLVETVINDGQPTTSSMTFVDVSGMTIVHKSPTSHAEHLLVTVSGFSRCVDTDGTVTGWCIVRVQVDGVDATPGGTTVFDSAPANGNDGNAWESHATQFAATVNGKGNHTVTLQYRVDEAATTFALDNVTMTVETMAAGAGPGGDGLMNEGMLCFEVGETEVTLDLSGPWGYNITKSSMGFATLQSNAGGGRYVARVQLYRFSDKLTLVLNKPATKQGCAAWHIIELEFAG